MNLGETIRSGVRWVIAGRIGQDLLHFGVSIVLARLLTPTDFGFLATMQIFTGVANFIAGGGLGQAIVQSKDLGPKDAHVVFTTQLCVCSIIYAIFYLSSPAFAAWFNEPLYETLLPVSAITFLLRPFSNTPSSLLHRAMNYKATATINMAILVVNGVVSISLARHGAGVWALVLGGICGGITNAVVSSALAGWRPRLSFDPVVIRRYANYGVKVSLNDIVEYLRAQTGKFVISRFISTEAIGLFTKATGLAEKPRSVLSGSAYRVVFRALAKVQENQDQSKYLYLRTLTLVSLYATPIYVTLWWVAEPFIITVYGKQWAEAAPLLKIVLLPVLFHILINQSGAVAAARRLLGRELVAQFVAWAVTIAGIAIGYQWGIIGIAWAAVLNTLPFALMMSRLACRELGVRTTELLRAFRPTLLLNGILGVVLWLTDRFFGAAAATVPFGYLLLMCGTAAVCYGACFLLLPIPELATEARRWKNALLPRRSESVTPPKE